MLRKRLRELLPKLPKPFSESRRTETGGQSQSLSLKSFKSPSVAVFRVRLEGFTWNARGASACFGVLLQHNALGRNGYSVRTAWVLISKSTGQASRALGAQQAWRRFCNVAVSQFRNRVSGLHFFHSSRSGVE